MCSSFLYLCLGIKITLSSLRKFQSIIVIHTVYNKLMFRPSFQDNFIDRFDEFEKINRYRTRNSPELSCSYSKPANETKRSLETKSNPKQSYLLFFLKHDDAFSFSVLKSTTLLSVCLIKCRLACNTFCALM